MELWAARLERDLSLAEEAALGRLLPRARLERLERVGRRAEPLCAYALLALALYERYGWRSLPEMGQGGQGKPYFLDHPELHFNLSHTRGAVLVGLSAQPIGVDIERVRPVNPKTVRRLTGEELDAAAFFSCWVRREARTKRSGGSIVSMMRGEPPLTEGERYTPLAPFEGFAAGVAGQETPRGVEVRRIEELVALSRRLYD